MINDFSEQCPNGNNVAQFERFLRIAIFKPANELVGFLLQQAVNRADAAYVPKPGEARKGRRSLEVQGIFGAFTLVRDYYYHKGKRVGSSPADNSLGLDGAYTPALARLICLEGSDESSFEKASTHMKELGEIEISERQIQRVVGRVGESAQAWQERDPIPGTCDARVMYISVDATGVPMRKEELQGRKGKSKDGKAKTRMVNLAAIFTQSKEDDNGRALRDWHSTTYLSSFKTSSDFGIDVRHEALRRGLLTVKETVLLVDGANCLKKLGRDYFENAVQIVDFYHALEHLDKVLEALWGKDNTRRMERGRHHWGKLLLHDGVERFISAAKKKAYKLGKVGNLDKEIGYFENNILRMQYGSFRKKAYFIGSGVIEAGCRTAVGQRCKQSGMFWSEKGASSILALRCIHQSRYQDDFWRDRLNSQALLNQALPHAA